MTVKVVTDTLSDISFDLAAQLGVTVVPLYVRFGEEIYKDRVEITAEDFYRRLVNEPKLPSTTQPSPAEFMSVYENLAKETDEILVVTLSSKMSGTYQSACQARDMLKNKVKIEVIDSLQVALGEGLLVMSAVNAIKKGANLAQAAEVVRKGINRVHVIAYFDTLKYLVKGGRIGKAQGLVGSLLSVKPILTTKEGEMAPLTRVRSLNAGMDYLYSVVETYKDKIEGLAIEHTTTKVEADKLVERINGSKIYPKEKIYREIISPVIGTYTGPGTVALLLLEAEK